MSNRWPINGNSDIGGILKRKNPTTIPQNNEKNLLIFGYGCKIFRDDEKAKFIDQGKHLIAWMGNNNHKIDRYDVRATLSDLSPYEPPAGGYENRLDYLTPEEKRAEELCEEERYYSLKHNEEEELMYQEEELKRLHQERSSTYGQVKFDYNATTETSTATNEEDDTSKSEGSDELFTPPKNFEIPISIVTPDTMKQHAIVEKTAKFIAAQGPQMEILIKAKQSNNPQFEFLNQNNILNPYYKFILSALKNDTYPKEDEQTEILNNTKLESAQNSYDSLTTQSSISIHTTRIPVPIIQYKPSANCAYTQLISKIKGVPLPVITSNAEQSNNLLNGSNQQNHNNLLNTINDIQNNTETNQHSNNVGCGGVEIKQFSSALALAQCYSSDSESENLDDHDEQQKNLNNNLELSFNSPIPPENEKNVIDKTAAYVAKNGKQFEETLKLKGDERFLFLHENHEYHSYYIYKVTGVVPPPKPINKNRTLFVPAPVSFSIKTKDDNTVPIKPALPQETSDDESENKSANQAVPISKLPEHVQKAIQLVENQLVAKSAKTVVGAQAMLGMVGVSGSQIRSRFDIDSAGNPINRQILNTQTILENQKELKRAEEKVKDRLAQIAREKLGLLSKEKQLQIERKKKAMAFLNQIKGSTEQTMVNNDNKLTLNDDRAINDNNSDKESVHSIPISSYGGEDDAKSDYEYYHNYRPSPFLTPEQQDDVEFVSITKLQVQDISKSRSRSRSKSNKHKKNKHHHHSKKKTKRKSRSRSRSESYSLSPNSSNRKHSSSSKKLKKMKRERD